MYTEVDIFFSRKKEKQESPQITILKNFVANIDYYLGTGDLNKVNNELNQMCKYILVKEGHKLESPDGELEEVDIAKGFHKPELRMGMNDIPEKPIPHTKYNWYKNYYGIVTE